MPIISSFYGVVIRMYFNDTEQHNTPHLHAKYGEHSAVFDLNGKKLVGKFPPKQTKIVVAWIAIHKDELSALWEIMQTSDEYFKIKGLE